MQKKRTHVKSWCQGVGGEAINVEDVFEDEEEEDKEENEQGAFLTSTWSW